MHKGIFYRGLMLSLLSVLVFLTGCGGGGGGGGAVGGNATVTGRILRAESNTRPDPVATINIGGITGTSNPNDGSFTLTGVSSSVTTATITAQGAADRTLTIALTANQTNNLGDIFISDTGYNATVTGRVVTNVNNQQQGVAGATVNITGVTVTTGQNGAFTVNNLPVGLGSVPGIYGSVTATGFDKKDITAETLEFPLTAGANPLTNPIVILPPSGSVPLPPHTISGTVTLNGVATNGAAITLTNAAQTVFLTATTDTTGRYSFWVVPGTYTVTATLAGNTEQAQVTLTRLDTPVTAPTINL